MKATGIFSWPASERMSDRYGFVGLYTQNYDETTTVPVALDIGALNRLYRKRVRIVVRVLEARESGHVGDLFRGIFPTTPVVGEVVDLGEGTLVVDQVQGVQTFGLFPDDGRYNDWFDPKKLYRLHDQTVEIEITQIPEN